MATHRVTYTLTEGVTCKHPGSMMNQLREDLEDLLNQHGKAITVSHIKLEPIQQNQ